MTRSAMDEIEEIARTLNALDLPDPHGDRHVYALHCNTSDQYARDYYGQERRERLRRINAKGIPWPAKGKRRGGQ